MFESNLNRLNFKVLTNKTILLCKFKLTPTKTLKTVED